MSRIANKDARSYVQQRKDFKGSNLWGQTFEDCGRYVVYSYDTHWPLFIYDEGAWFENADRYSRTTNRHHAQCRPGCATTRLPSRKMVDIAMRGSVALATERILEAA